MPSVDRRSYEPSRITKTTTKTIDNDIFVSHNDQKMYIKNKISCFGHGNFLYFYYGEKFQILHVRK